MFHIDPNQAAHTAQLEEMKKRLLARMLTKEAYERLGRVRMVNSQLAGQVEVYLLKVYQSGKLQEKITDEKMRSMLSVLSSDKKPLNITRK